MKVQGKTIEILRFADDIFLFANTERGLEEALNVTATVFNNYNNEINIGKTKVIACSKILQLLVLNIDLEIRKKLLKATLYTLHLHFIYYTLWLRSMDYS